MRQTVLGVYDSYMDARSAQQELGQAGVALADVAVYSMSASTPNDNGPRVYAPGGATRRHEPVFDQLEQLFARLFKQGEYPPETEDYREFIRRGGAVLSADVSETQVDLACDVMRRAGATDIEERSSGWRNRSASMDEPVPAHQRHATGSMAGDPSSWDMPDPAREDEAMPTLDTLAQPGMARGTSATSSGDPVAARHTDFSRNRTSVAGGMQQVTTRTETQGPASFANQQQQFSDPASDSMVRQSPDEIARVEARESIESRTIPQPAQQTSPRGLVGDPLLGTPLDDPYDDEFRTDFDTRYAETGASYDEYRPAYAQGARMAQDERYREQDWQRVESNAREDWEAQHPENENGWDRFKAAVRHGWERVTGQ